FPDLVNFDSDLHYVEKASLGKSILPLITALTHCVHFLSLLNVFFRTVSLENILADIHELEKGMELCKKEADLRKEYKESLMLKEFIAPAEDKLRKLQTDAKNAQVFVNKIKYKLI